MDRWIENGFYGRNFVTFFSPSSPQLETLISFPSREKLTMKLEICLETSSTNQYYFHRTVKTFRSPGINVKNIIHSIPFKKLSLQNLIDKKGKKKRHNSISNDRNHRLIEPVARVASKRRNAFIINKHSKQRGNFYPRDATGTAYRGLARAPEPTQDLRPRNHPLIHELCAPQPHRPRLRPPIFSVSSIQCSLRARGARRTSRKHGRKMEERAGKGSPPLFSLGEV